MENTAAMGVPYPKFIKDMLDVMKEKTSSGETKPLDKEEQADEVQM